MLVHNYLFSQKIERDGKFIHEGIEFRVLFPIEKNESAQQAMNTLAEILIKYLKKTEKTVPAYDIEYLGNLRTDKFQDEIIKKDGYTIIPSEEKIQEKLG